MINKITAETGVKIDIEQDGRVLIASPDGEAAARAQRMIEDIVKEAKPGEVYRGRVTRVMNFGAFVEIFPGKEGLVHISELSPNRVNKVEDVVKVGDEVEVKVKEIDNLGRVNLTRRGLVPGDEAQADLAHGEVDGTGREGERPDRRDRHERAPRDRRCHRPPRRKPGP